MSAFAGFASLSGVSPNPMAIKAMVDPAQKLPGGRVDQYDDSLISVAVHQSDSQQVLYTNGNLVVVADCRLSEFCEGEDWGRHSEQQMSPGKLLAEAFDKWGASMVDRLNGAFAFAIWNKQNQSLFCARDRFGHVPFCYQVTPVGLVFSTDFLSIAKSRASQVNINHAWIIEYIHGVIADNSSTPFKDIKSLPPGCTLTWKEGGFEIKRYWSFDQIATTTGKIEIEELSEALEASVQRRLLSGNLAALLSGGVDSSALAILARDLRAKQHGSNLPTFSLIVENSKADSDLPYIKAVLSQGGFDPHFVRVKHFDVFNELKRLVRVHGAPTLAPAAPILDQAMVALKDAGFDTVIDGHGGDEIISGSGRLRFVELANSARWFSLIREMVQASHVTDLDVLDNFGSLYSTFGNGLSRRIIRRIRSRLRKQEDKNFEPYLLNMDWVKHPSAELSERILKQERPSEFRSEREFQESILKSAVQPYALAFLFRQYRSRGLRVEIPFWDSRVIDLCLRAPSSQKLNNGVPRSLIKDVMGDRFPREVKRRNTKFDFSDCFIESIKLSKDQVSQIALEHNHTVFEFVSRDTFLLEVQNLESRDRAVRLRAARSVWAVLNVFCWLDMVEALRKDNKKILEIVL